MNASLHGSLKETMLESSEMAPVKHQMTLPAWLKNLVFCLLALLAILYLLDRLYSPNNFPITEVSVHGELENIPSTQVVEALQAAVDGNFFSIDLSQLSDYVKSLPWVYDVSMRLVWPNTLHVTIEEVQPIARWDDEFWMHQNGDLVGRVTSANDEDLPLLSGPESMSQEVWEQYVKWQNTFERFGIELKNLTLDERELWRVHLAADYFADVDDSLGLVNATANITHEVEMVIPIENASQRVSKFIVAMQPQLLSQFLQMKKVDLRYPNGFAIGWDETRKVQQQIDNANDQTSSQ